MYQIIIVIHVLLGLGIIGLILIQQGKGADAGASFGTGGSASVFGAQGAGSFLSRTTATLATFFFITSLGLAIMNGRQGAAYDLMGAEEAKKGEVAIPQVDNSKIPEAPVVAPEAKLPDQPLTPASPALNQAIEKMQEAPIPVATPEAVPSEAKPATEQPPAAAEEIKNTVVPKADVIKTVEPTPPVEAKPATKTTEKPKKTVKKKKPVDKKDSEKK